MGQHSMRPGRIASVARAWQRNGINPQASSADLLTRLAAGTQRLADASVAGRQSLTVNPRQPRSF